MKDFMYPEGPLETKDAGNGGEGGNAPDTTEIKKQLDAYDKTVQAFMTKTDETIAELKKGKDVDPLDTETGKKMQKDMDDLKKSIENLRLKEARPVVTALDGTKTELTEDQVEHKKAFDTYFRKGRGEEELREMEQKTLSVGTDPDGGVVVPVQTETAIDRVITEISQVRQIARVVQVSTASYKRLTGQGGANSGWVGEQEARPQTNTPTLAAQEYPVMELYAMPAATQSILDDAAINIDGWLADEVAIEFAYQEGAAFVNGNGADKPTGFLQGTKVANGSWSWGKTGYIATGVSGDWADNTGDPGAEATNIIDLVYGLKPTFRSNARFTMNRSTVASVMKLRDADGRPLWHTNLREGQPDTLMGYPVTELEDMPDIAADSFSIGFGDFQRGYIIVDRIGTRVLRDPFSSKPYVLFYTTKRVGGGLGHYDAIKLLKFGTS